MAKATRGSIKYLGNPTRYSILKALYLNPKESMSVTELEAQIDSTQSQTSQYLSVLKTVGLLTSVNKGVRRYYSIADDRINAIFDALKV